MAKKTPNLPDKSKKNNESTPKSRRKEIVISIGQIFRNLSISINLTVYTIYLIYLIYSISANVGSKPVNIALALGTAAFMSVYLVLRLSRKRRGKQLKMIKHYYKNFKLVARTFSAVTAVYALTSAISAVSPMAIIISFLGAAFLVIRLIVELILGLIRRKIRKAKAANNKAENEDIDELDETDEDENQPRTRRRRRKMRKKPRYRRSPEDTNDDIEPIIIPVDACLLNDIEE